MRVVLIFPPKSDPTICPTGVQWLQSYVEENSDYKISTIDANIEGYTYCARAEKVSSLLENAERSFFLLRKCKKSFLRSISGLETYLYRLAWAMDITPKVLSRSIQVLQSEKLFFDFPQYLHAASIVNRWNFLLSNPLFYKETWLGTTEWNIFNYDFMNDEAMLDFFVEPFKEYIHENLLPKISALDPQIVGVSINYSTQFIYSIYISKELKKRNPHINVILGGTNITKRCIYSRIEGYKSFSKIFKYVDNIILGDGEGAFLSLLSSYNGKEPTHTHYGYISRDNFFESSSKPLIVNYEELEDKPKPQIKDIPWKLYFSPKRFLGYPLTKGCYWNRCTFCEYGSSYLSPAAKYRERPLSNVLDDLKELSQQVDLIGFTVDCVSPKHIISLANSILEMDIKINWAVADLRLEKEFTRNVCEMLHKSGLVSISVGYESANQRVLNMMNKGTNLEERKIIIVNFLNSKISIELMAFLDFPTETYDEAMDTIRSLQNYNRNNILGIIKKFYLPCNSKVAKNEDKFGIRKIKTNPQSGIVEYKEISPSKTNDEFGRLEDALFSFQQKYIPFALPYPFLGAIGAFHSYLYIKKLGIKAYSALISNGCYERKKKGIKKVKLRNGFIAENMIKLVREIIKSGELPEVISENENLFILENGQLLKVMQLREIRNMLSGKYSFNEVKQMLASRNEKFVSLLVELKDYNFLVEV